MSKSFDKEEALSALQRADQVLLEFQNINQYHEGYKKQAEQLLQTLHMNGFFIKSVENDIVNGILESEHNPQFEELLYKIYLYIHGEQLVSIANQSSFFVEKVNAARTDLLLSTKPLRWFFSGRAKKDKAYEALQFLKDVDQTPFAHQINSLYKELMDLSSIDMSQVLNEYKSNQEPYRRFVRDWDQRLFLKKTNLPGSEAVNRDRDSLDQIIANIDNLAEKRIEEIKSAVDRYTATEVLSALRDVPIDQLNRDKSGLRLKGLKEFGFGSVADIYSASEYNLSSVPGVSYNSAYLIKHRAKKFVEETQKDIKVKLTSDNKSKEATELVRAIYEYKKCKRTKERVNEILKSKEYDLKRAGRTLDTYQNEVAWVFSEAKNKKEMIDAYQYLKNFFMGTDYASIQYSTKSLYQNNSSSNEAWQNFNKNPIEYYTILENVVPGILGNDDKVYGLPEELAREIQEECFFPDGLKCTLRRYQEWGVKYILHQEKALLGDEMGLGKTVQAIATMVSLRNVGENHFLVICPASVLANWQNEILKKSKLKVVKIHGKDRNQALRQWVNNGGVAVTTYETTASLQMPDSFLISLIIVDEAHYIKNPDAQRTKNVKGLCDRAKRILFMTGTALENHVDEMIALISILQPAIAMRVRNLGYLSTAQQFREKIAPVYYRRKREDVLTELPELIESQEWCTLSAKEERAYEKNVLNRNYAAARQVSWNVSSDLKDSCKAKRMLELIEEAEADGRKILVFSFFLNTINAIHAFLGDRCTQPINGSVLPQRRQQIIDEFDRAPSGSVLLAQIQSGGTGLNIQSASVVIICEPQFKPSIENQAISRAYRMGQARNVLVYRLLCENTVDEKITDMLAEKQAIFNAFADKSVAGQESISMDEKTFGDIISEEIERIKEKNKSA